MLSPLRPLSDPRRQRRGDFLTIVPIEGTLRLADGQRTAILPASFLGLLTAELAGPLGDSARHVFYKFGYDWALRDMVRLSRELSQEFGGGADLDLWQLDAKFVLDRWWSQLATAGWGACSFDLTSHARGFTFAELRESVAVANAPKATQPVCHLYAGMLAGALSFFERSERHAVEFQCAALGAPSCRFVIGAGPQIDEVESWRHQRIAPEEIRRRLA